MSDSMEMNEQNRTQFALMMLWGNYLFEYGHNTMEEVTAMDYTELEARFRQVTNTESNGVEVN